MAAARLAMLLAAMGLAGCTMSMPMGSLLSRADKTEKKSDDDIATGSIGKTQSATVPAVLTESKESITVPIAAEDWDFAKKALIEALSSKDDTPSVPWENDKTRARGSVTALQRFTGANGNACRPFLGSSLRDKADVWFEGRACKNPGGDWEMQDLRPWKRI